MSEPVYPKEGDGAIILIPVVGVKVNSNIPVEITQRRRWMERLYVQSDQKTYSRTEKSHLNASDVLCTISPSGGPPLVSPSIRFCDAHGEILEHPTEELEIG